MSLPYQVMFRGLPACPCEAEWIPAFEAKLHAEGVLPPGVAVHIYQLIGGAPESGGTHTKGGAHDTNQVSDAAIKIARQMGSASFHRPAGWDGPGSIEHAHGVLKGCPHNSPAAYQITALEEGYNGLGLNGRAGRDTGPRAGVQFPLRTWQEGIAWAKAPAPAAKKAPWVHPGIKAAIGHLKTVAADAAHPVAAAKAKAALKALK